MNREGIACAGNLILDEINIIDSWPNEGHLANILSKKQGTGGLVCNVLTGLAKFQTGVPLTAIGLVGMDNNGDSILEDMKSYGIDITHIVRTDREPTSYTEVMSVKDTGQRTLFHNRGANKLLSEKHFHWKHLQGKMFHLGYILILDSLDQPDMKFGTKAASVLHEALEHGFKTSLDVVSEMSDRFKNLVPPALPYVDYLIINELEAGHTTGFKIRNGEKLDRQALHKAAQELMNMGVKELVVIHFPEGAYALTKKGQKAYQSSLLFPEGYIQSTAGAGDAFCVGVLYGIHEDWDLDESLRLGIAAAGTSLNDATCTSSMRSLDETLNLFSKFPLRKGMEI